MSSRLFVFQCIALVFWSFCLSSFFYFLSREFAFSLLFVTMAVVALSAFYRRGVTLFFNYFEKVISPATTWFFFLLSGVLYWVFIVPFSVAAKISRQSGNMNRHNSYWCPPSKE